MTYDVAIIGGGIVGLATGMALGERFAGSLVVIEAEDRPAAHQTGHNSGVIHSGLYYKPGSLKARNCVAGREALYHFCREHGIAHERCGKVVVATGRKEIAALDRLERRGKANGLLGLKRLEPAELRRYEPHVAGRAGLLVPETGIVDFRQVAEKYAEIVTRGGGEIRTGCRFLGLARDAAELVLETTAGPVRCRNLVNCAGLQCDRVMTACGLRPDIRIIPFRGEYYEIVPSRQHLVRNLIYPVPDPRFPFLGVHFTRMIHGGIEAGPNAVLSLARHGYDRFSFNGPDVLEIAGYGGFWQMAARYGEAGIGEVYRSLRKRAFVRALQQLVPELQPDDIRPGGAGVRAQAVARDGRLLDDFHIVRADRMIHVLNAPSPAATASIAIGRAIAGLAARDFDLA